jgi:GMP synthase (glutamine-hydrolysing)
VCYGAQLLAQQGGGEVTLATRPRVRLARLAELNEASLLTSGMHVPTRRDVARRHHSDAARHYNIIASTPEVAVAAFKMMAKTPTQHPVSPEATHSTEGKQLLSTPCRTSANAPRPGRPTISAWRCWPHKTPSVPTHQVILVSSGGVDSSVAAPAAPRHWPAPVTASVDNGLLRKDEFETVPRPTKLVGPT